MLFSAASDPAPVIVSSAFSYCSNETTKIRPNLPEEEVNVDMIVLAKKGSMRWQRGKILEIVTKGKKIVFPFCRNHCKASVNKKAYLNQSLCEVWYELLVLRMYLTWNLVKILLYITLRKP